MYPARSPSTPTGHGRHRSRWKSFGVIRSCDSLPPCCERSGPRREGKRRVLAREMNFQYGHKPEATRMPLVLRQFTRIAGANKHSLVLGGSAALFLPNVAAEIVAPAHRVRAYGLLTSSLPAGTAR